MSLKKIFALSFSFFLFQVINADDKKDEKTDELAVAISLFTSSVNCATGCAIGTFSSADGFVNAKYEYLRDRRLSMFRDLRDRKLSMSKDKERVEMEEIRRRIKCEQETLERFNYLFRLKIKNRLLMCVSVIGMTSFSIFFLDVVFKKIFNY